MIPKRQFLPTASNFDPNVNIQGWYVSEKLDGQHCFWDGGLSRGFSTNYIPWSEDSNEESTGLWTNDGKPLYLSDHILDKFPNFICEGVLHQEEFAIFSSPPLEYFFKTGWITSRAVIYLDVIQSWLEKNDLDIFSVREGSTFEQELFALRAWGGIDQIYLLKQQILPNNTDVYSEILRILDKSSSIIIRDPKSIWVPQKVKTMMTISRLNNAR